MLTFSQRQHNLMSNHNNSNNSLLVNFVKHTENKSYALLSTNKININIFVKIVDDLLNTKTVHHMS